MRNMVCRMSRAVSSYAVSEFRRNRQKLCGFGAICVPVLKGIKDPKECLNNALLKLGREAGRARSRV